MPGKNGATDSDRSSSIAVWTNRMKHRWSTQKQIQHNSPFLLKYLITDFNEVPIKTIIPVQRAALLNKKSMTNKKM